MKTDFIKVSYNSKSVIMTELEDKVIKPLINDGAIKFYCWYVDDTLLVVKPQDVSRIHKLLNSFDKNLKFTVDLFENEVHHFLDVTGWNLDLPEGH